MGELIYDFDYSEEKQKEIIKRIEGYVPLLEKLISLFYPKLKFSIKSSLSHRVNLFAGYYEPKIEITVDNFENYLKLSSNDIDVTFKIRDTESFINVMEFCDSIYSYLPDVLYNTSLIVGNCKESDIELDFEEYALRKEVQSNYFSWQP